MAQILAPPRPAFVAGPVRQRPSSAVEIGDWTRFTGSFIGSYLGLVPSENSSGQSRRQGPITKAGNTYARKLLIEAA